MNSTLVKVNKKITALSPIMAIGVIAIFGSSSLWAADKIGRWEPRTAAQRPYLVFDSNLEVSHYPEGPVVSNVYTFPRDNPPSSLDISNLTTQLRKKEYNMATYRIPVSGVNTLGCFQARYLIDNQNLTPISTASGTVWQVKSFPYLGFKLRVRTRTQRNAGIGQNYDQWHDVNSSEFTFPTSCTGSAAMRITPIMEIEPIILNNIPTDIKFENGEANINLSKITFGYFYLQGRDASTGNTWRPDVEDHGGASIVGSNVTIKTNATTCDITSTKNHFHNFGKIRSTDLDTPKQGPEMSIIVNCGRYPTIDPHIVFSDANTPNNTSDVLSMFYTGGVASNIGIKLRKKTDSTYIKFGPHSSKKGITNQFKMTPIGNYRFSVTFTPELIKKNSSANVDGGVLEGLATYTLSYQ
ncbi:fimbrial protein [Haemophilus influenzae]|uniref:fimbrial protein n=1 Tax=Haemophilus influenzae TaxID=727 RepID=UPI000DD31014|nr:fimbrial protein [Haemophilus influenzae]